MLQWLIWGIFLFLIVQTFFLGKKSILARLGMKLGLPGITGALHWIFSRDSFIVRGIKSIAATSITLVHGIFSYRKGYEEGYRDAIEKRSKRWWTRWLKG